MAYHIGLVIEDATYRRELARAIQDLSGHRVVFSTDSDEEAIAQLEQEPADLVIVELGRPRSNGVELLRRLSSNNPGTEIMVITVEEDEALLFEALRAGALGYLWKGTLPAEVINAIADLRKGGVPMSKGVARRIVQAFNTRHEGTQDLPPVSTLTNRETEILGMLAQGLTYQNVAHRLKLSAHTVHSHIRNIYRKLQVNSRSEAVYQALRRKMLQM